MLNSFFKVFLPIIAAIILTVALYNYNIYAGLLAAVVCLSLFAYLSRITVYVILGNKNYAAGDLTKGLSYYEKAYNTGKCKANTIISYSYLLLRSGQLEKPEKLLNSILEKDLTSDEEMSAKSNLALVLWKKGNIDEATSTLEEVFENYKNTTIYGSLGYMYILKGDLNKALEFNLEAYEYNSSNSVVLDNLGQTYFLRGEYDKAEEIYNKLMDSRPTSPGIYYNYGLVLAEKGQTEEALEFMRKALSYKITFLSGVTEEEIKCKIEQLEKGIG